MASVIEIGSSDDHDELDIMLIPESITAPVPASRFLAGSNTSAVAKRRTSMRIRASEATKSPSMSLVTKRKRPEQDENQDLHASKKFKMQDKKALTILIHSNKSKVEAARRIWLHRHKHIFLPLLPPKSNFFDTLEKELKSNEKPYTPLHELDEQPSLVKGGQMKDYQLHGLSFLVWMHTNGMNCILGDEMGLGKTLQTLSLFAYVKEHFPVSDPHLVICPLSVLPSWLSEASFWVPSLKTLRFHGLQAERDRLKNGSRDGKIVFDVCVTTYETFVSEDSWFKSRRWNYCVLDEGHKIKNSDTTISIKLQGVGSLHRLLLTGTPIHNDLKEVWGLLHWLYPQVFTAASQRLFQDAFDLSRGSYSIPFLKAAQNLMSTVMLRRTKAVVELSVPPKEELTVFVPLTEAQRFWYFRLLTRMDTVDMKQVFTAKLEAEETDEGRRQVQEHLQSQMSQTKSGEQSAWKRLMNLLMQLRKVCDHPYLLPDAEPTPFEIGEHIVASSSKIIAIDKILSDILPKGERVLIFSQWTNMLDLLEDYMALRSIPYARLDGSTTRPRRALDIRLFQQEKSPYQVFLISTKAGGLGINLTKATTVIMVDSDWNPQNDLQAIARAHRIGQKKIVKVYRLICGGSVEDQMLDRIRRKLFLSLKVMGGDTASSDDNSSLGTSELMDILRKGSSALSRSGDDGLGLNQFLDAPVEEIFEASRKREGRKDVKLKRELGDTCEVKKEDVKEEDLQDIEEEEKKLLSGIAVVQSRLFEGQIVKAAEKKKNSNKDIANEWQEVQKRARIDRVVTIDGIQVIADHVAPLTTTGVVKPPPKRQRKKFESEDWCIYCRDGGEVVLCHVCPRVFHAKCHGISVREVKRQPLLTCNQHSCCSCSRSTADAGGMLFRCQTCPQAFCEDCLPPGELMAVGETIPEFVLLGYGENKQAYYIRCHECQERFAEEPDLLARWEEEVEETAEKLRTLMQSDEL